jgi:hypothetical protein
MVDRRQLVMGGLAWAAAGRALSAERRLDVEYVNLAAWPTSVASVTPVTHRIMVTAVRSANRRELPYAATGNIAGRFEQLSR